MKPQLVICPGIHSPALTEAFVKELEIAISGLESENCDWFGHKDWLVLPIAQLPVYSGYHVLNFLRDRVALSTPLIFLAFSAGVVGASSAAWGWQQLGGQVQMLIALDGWGVPLIGDYPIHRVSHDSFTHWSSCLLGTGGIGFYAEPAVAHLDLWRSPQAAIGWQVTANLADRRRTTAAQCIAELLLWDGIATKKA